MKKFISIKSTFVLVPVLALAMTQCYLSPVAGPGQITGTAAKKQISDAAQDAAIIRYALASSKARAICGGNPVCISYWTAYYGSAGFTSILLDGIVVPVLAGIADDRTYKKDSVDQCSNSIRTAGMVIDSWLLGITCNVQQSQTIQIGPIGIL